MKIEHGGNLRAAAERYGIRESELLDFSANINPHPLPADLAQLVADNFDVIKHYPDPDYKRLRGILAGYHELDPDCLVLGNGVSELIPALIRAIRPARVVVVGPAYAEYEAAAATAGSPIERVLMTAADGFAVDANRIAAAARSGDLVFLGNPNNPTGRLAGRAELLAIAESLLARGVTLAVDEAFIDFAGDEGLSLARAAAEKPGLAVLRAFTKFWGMPGLRFGWLIAAEELAARVRDQLPPWNINFMVEPVVRRLLPDDEFRKQSLELVRAARTELQTGLRALAWLAPFPSEANFILVRIKGGHGTAPDLAGYLGRQGILIRNAGNFAGLDDRYFRIAVRLPDENRRLLAALRGYPNG